ncbi:uncharacterized protein OCT59_026722 [Rhizophagus irregularis]|uniref:F-box domain-containing protein n=2 Tax=Rhizophagus irregularis TaxID=588596 RepID=A0A015N3U9_RHIIW|nr:hypothetical protein RirG_057230 [Rhizophagus irregularis DAOM 197198w]UZO06397.1 hypothetical protein OCT59_026722 [Rhizophagus irregularis]GBC16436.1 hypothetical protein GLOIN_2v1764020 [Rhizophagus irregularis DAOM 181602=DAOM 197198]
MVNYNSDILLYILEELQYDPMALFSCLLVNRLWCEMAISILWRNPWQYKIDYRNKNSLLNVICSYLPKDIEPLLPSHLLPSRSFNYMSFCKSINIEIIKDITFMIKSTLLQEKIRDLLIEKCTKLNYLNMISIDSNLSLFQLPKNKTFLASLYELTCGTSTCPSFFRNIALVIQNIQRLIIINENNEINKGIIELINVQKNLRYFEWKDDFEDEYDIKYDLYDEMLVALQRRSETIFHLILYFQFFNYEECHDHKIFDILPRFLKLKTLTLNKYYLESGRVLPIYYNNLEILHIDDIAINVAINIVTNSGGNIREILSNYKGYYDDENSAKNTLLLISSIIKKCPLIKALSLIFPSTKLHFVEFETLLKSCQNLKKLVLIIDDDCNENYERGLENAKELLEILNRSAPTGLIDIKVYNNSEPYLEILEPNNIRLGDPEDLHY